jgi:uncharacterized protein
MSEFIDNRANRIETLKEIIKRLHQGADPDDVRRELTEIVKQTDSSEIAAMEQALIAEGMPVEEVQSMCDLHSEVLRDLLVESVSPATAGGHPVDTMQRENAALSKVVARMHEALDEINGLDDETVPDQQLTALRSAFNDLMDVEKHYRRKENLLFSFLEKHGVTGPSKVMWGKDDEVRELLKTLGEALEQDDAVAGDWKVAGEAVAKPSLAAVEEMIFKETEILFPMALSTLTADDWGEIWTQSPDYGWCLVEPGSGYSPPRESKPAHEASLGKSDAIRFGTGALTFQQIDAMLKTLPVDVTFVDADDRVAFFSEGGSRVFARSKAIIGRKVQHCHPPKSVDTVERIVADFRAGEQDVAEFWIQSQGMFVHIRYFAMRDEQGEYLGTLEVTQDIAPLRQLDGEQRLLSYND